MSERPLPRPIMGVAPVVSLARRREANLARLIYIRRMVAEIVFIAGLLMALVGLATFLIAALGPL